MSTVFYPSIYDNAYNYTELVNNSIIITAQTGYGAVPSANNTVLICNENGQWVTSSLDNYATSSDITDIQNSINTLSTYDDILQQSIYSNLTAINTLQTNLTNNYFTKDEITSSSDMLTNMLGETFYEISREISILSDDVTTISNDITTISNNVQILTEDIIHMQDTFANLDQNANWFTFVYDIWLEGTWKLYGTVTLYISDITKMTPKVNTLTEVEWIDALPVFEIQYQDIYLGVGEEADSVTVSEEKIESNRPFITIPINALLTNLLNSQYNISSLIVLPSFSDINITKNDISLYKYNLYLERISGYKNVNELYPPE